MTQPLARVRDQISLAIKNPRTLRRASVALFVWLCLVKVPATALRDSMPQSWEGVLSFGTAHHLAWGRDVVFTYGPLGFLISDYYWGNFFWPIILWAFGFSLVLTSALLKFSHRLSLSIRIPFYLGLALLTVPTTFDLGFDSIYFLSITVFGIACLPDENPTQLRLITSAIFFSVLCLIKFTFALYSIFALIVIATAWVLRGNGRKAATLLAAWLLSFLLCWTWSGQNLSTVLLHFARSFQVASGYSSAMAISAERPDLIVGLALILCLAVLALSRWFSAGNWRSRLDRAAILGAGAFLAWKEGFVRADEHVVVFLVFSFLLAPLMPALMVSSSTEARKVENDDSDSTSTNLAGTLCLVSTPRWLILFTAATMLVAVSPFATHRKNFTAAVKAGAVPKFSETIQALLTPATFKRHLEGQLDAMRARVVLPQIRDRVAQNSVGVLGLDQDVALLNDLNYVPHPIFQSYSAYTPDLQRLNAEFFNSSQAPDYVLWRMNTIDARFPTLDDGAIMLKMLSAYSPVMQERGFTLWQRNDASKSPPTLGSEKKFTGTLDQWIPIPAEPTWLRVDMQKTWLGSLQGLLWSSSDARIEVQLENGNKLRYRMPPELAHSGFVLNPLLQTDANLLPASANTLTPHQIRAVRVYCLNNYFFKPSLRAMTQTISGIAALEPASNNANPLATVLKE